MHNIPFQILESIQELSAKFDTALAETRPRQRAKLWLDIAGGLAPGLRKSREWIPPDEIDAMTETEAAYLADMIEKRIRERAGLQ